MGGRGWRGGKSGGSSRHGGGDGGRGKGARGAKGVKGAEGAKGAKGARGAKGAKGRGRGYGKGGGDAGSDAKPVAVGNEHENGDSGSHDARPSRALSSTLRAYASPEWWLLGQGGELEGGAKRKLQKPEDFKRDCTEHHTEMKDLYESTMMQDSEQRWLRKVCSDGTSGDKIASLTLLIQVCPVFSTSYIKTLLNMTGKSARSDSLMAVDALKDLFINTLLPDRKLKTLSQMEPLSSKGIDKHRYTEKCVVAFFEDYLKTVFAAFVHVLSEMAHNALVFYKIKAIKTACELLVRKPEQERALLGLLVNKFGDSAPKVSSTASFQLKKLVETHAAMHRVVSDEVEVFLSRPNITEKSRYCALVHLSETRYARKDGTLAAQLIRLFVKQLEDILRLSEATKKKAPDKKFKKKGRKRDKVKKKARWRGEDYNRLIRTCISGVHRAVPYLDAATAGSALLKVDTVNTLFRVCHSVSAFSTRIAILSLLYQCVATQREPPDRFYRLLYEQITHFEFFTNTHHLQAFLLLRKCVPADVSLSRCVAVCRRLLQVGANAEPSVSVAALAVLRDAFVAHRAEIRPLLQSSDTTLQAATGVDDDEEEHFVDDDVPGVDSAAAPTPGVAPDRNAGAIKLERKCYNPMAREPQHSRSRHTPLWELYALAHHVHPSVVQNATHLLSGETFQDFSKNPFDTFSSSELLEQFVQASRATERDQGKDAPKRKRVSLNTAKFRQEKAVAPHERFCQLYFSDAVVQKYYKRKASRKRQRDDDVDEEDARGQGEDNDEDADDQEEEDRFFEEHLRGQMPKDEDEDDGDEDDTDDPDIDDDSDAGGSDAGFEGGEAGEEDEGSCDEGSAAGSGSEGPGAGAGRKRRAADADLPRLEKIKKLKKRHASSMFASVEDFEQLLAEDDGS